MSFHLLYCKSYLVIIRSLLVFQHPGLSNQKLKELHKIDTSDFDGEFVERTTEAVNGILAAVQPKSINSNTVDGNALATFLEGCIQTLNSHDSQLGVNLSVNYNVIIQYAAEKVANESFEWYRSMMVATFDEGVLPVTWNTFEEKHEEALNTAETYFNDNLLGNGTHLLKAYQQFRRNVERFLTQIREKNSESLYSCNRITASSFWQESIVSQLTPDNLFSVSFSRSTVLVYKLYDLA
jgi:hypothetical protein